MQNKPRYSKAAHLRKYLSKFIRVLGVNNVGTTKKPKLNVIHAILANNGIKPIDTTIDGYNLYSYNDLDGLNDTSITAGFEKWKDDMLRKDIENSEKERAKKGLIKPTYGVSTGSWRRNNNDLKRRKEMEKASDELLHQQETYFTDDKDDRLYESMFGKKIYMTQEQIDYILESKKKKKTIKNDKGEIVPEICPECGSKVGLYIQGEPVYRCSNKKCNKYFGTMPCTLYEDDEHKNVDKTKYIENDYGEKWKKLPVDSEIFKLIDEKTSFRKKCYSKFGIMDVAEVKDEEDGTTHYIAIFHGGLNGSGEWVKYLKDMIKIIEAIHGSYIIKLDVDVPDDVWTLTIGFRKEKLNEGASGYQPEDSDTYFDTCYNLSEQLFKDILSKLEKCYKQKEDNNIYTYLGIINHLLQVDALVKPIYYNNKDLTSKKPHGNPLGIELIKTCEKCYKYLENDKENRQGWRNFEQYQEALQNQHRIFKMSMKCHNEEANVCFHYAYHLNEGKNYVEPQKVLLVQKFLDNGFVRASMPIIGDDGYPKTMYIVGMKGTDGNVIKNMTAKQLFYLLQDKFQGIYEDKIKRDSFLKQVMKDWYNKKISREGLLSKNDY